MRIACIAFAVLTTQSAFGFGFQKHAQHQALEQLRSLRSTAVAPQGQCTDFSGTWAGTCTIADGRVEEETIRIDQWGCTDIVFNRSEYFSIEGQKTEGEASQRSLHQNQMDVDWNHDKSLLEARGLFSGREFEPKFRYSGSASSKLFMRGEQLVSEFSYRSEMKNEDDTTIYKGSRICEYDRQPDVPTPPNPDEPETSDPAAG